MTTKRAAAKFQASDRVSGMQVSSTLAAMQAAEALRAEGANVVDFGAGEPDFDTPENIKRAAADAMRAGKTKYTSTGGTRELQQSIIDFYAGTFGASYERNQVMATAGGKQESTYDCNYYSFHNPHIRRLDRFLRQNAPTFFRQEPRPDWKPEDWHRSLKRSMGA